MSLLNFGYSFYSFPYMGGWPIFALHHSHGGAPSLRFLQAWAAMLPAQRPFCTARCVCRRRSRPFRLREGRGARIRGGFCSLKAGPPAPPTLRFPERTGVALRSDLAHDNHQNSSFSFRLH